MSLSEQAISEIDSLLAEAPNDPYYWELKGQIQFESGFSEKAIEPYRRAVKAAPREPLLRVGLAQAILGTENPDTAQEAIDNLNIANRYEGNNSFAWHQLALAYTLLDNKAMAALASAERFAISGGVRETLRQAHYAAENLEADTPQWVRAHDLYLLARTALEDAYRRTGRKIPELPEEPKRKSEKGKEDKSADAAAESAESDSIPSNRTTDD